jgi:hypothetical protein
MALERANPIPPGTYYVDVFDQGAGPVASQNQPAAFEAWLRAPGTVARVLRRERRGNVTFTLFEVLEPSERWPLSAGLGLPTRASASTRLDDVVQVPEPVTSTGLLASVGEGIKSAAITVAVGYVIVKLLTKERR